MEKFDLVDANDKVIGVTNIEEAHELGFIHRITAVFAFTRDRKIYIQEYIKMNGLYGYSAGGHVLRGESYAEAAKRKAYEELNITDPLFGVAAYFSGDGCNHMCGLFEVTPSPEWIFEPSKQVEKITPMPLLEIVESMNSHPQKFVRGFRWAMYKYLEAQKLPYSIDREILGDVGRESALLFVFVVRIYINHIFIFEL